jgi:hypothetical protein
MKHMHQKIGHAGHDEKLRAGANENVERTSCQYPKVFGGECQSHRKHDDAENYGLCRPSYPFEKVGHEEGKYGNGRNEK